MISFKNICKSVKAKYQQNKAAVNAGVTSALVMVGTTAAHAEYTNTDMGTVVTMLTTAITDFKTAAMALITAGVGVAIVIYATKFGFRLVKSVLGRG